MSWLSDFSAKAEVTDQLVGKGDHVELLAAGVFSEAGSIFAELKKKGRETEAYPAYQNKLTEEIGDFLWYLTRLSALLSPTVLRVVDEGDNRDENHEESAVKIAFALGDSSGGLFRALEKGDRAQAAEQLAAVWEAFFRLCQGVRIAPRDAAAKNIAKVNSRWPETKKYAPLFDDACFEEERLPRNLDVEFRHVERSGTNVVMLRCNDLSLGDRLTDNIVDPDYYRFHDVFHFSYAVYLGWSPVLRALLRCKRKSAPEVDRDQDGARAGIIEEAVSAIVFSRAKEMKMFERIDEVDYELLKTIRDFVRGYEVDVIPLWQWNVAIREGYRVFRSLRDNDGGFVRLNLIDRTLSYCSSSGRSA